MAYSYPITEEQRAILNSFTCERLKDDPENLFLINSFEHRSGAGLVEKLKKSAWTEDREGSTAYYVIKNAAGEIVLFFSLKCGVLFDPNYVRKRMEVYGKNEVEDIWQEILQEEQYEQAKREGLTVHDPRQLWRDCYHNGDIESTKLMIQLSRIIGQGRYRQLVRDINLFTATTKEKKKEPNQNILRVPQSHAAIEMVEFCANERTQGCWDRKAMGNRSMGKTLFWWFIVPRMLQVNDLIGCEYVFLFAADHYDKVDENGVGSLINYYRSLHFQSMAKLGTVKPRYDYFCQFMCQRLKTTHGVSDDGNGLSTVYGLDHHRDAFFETFNEDPNAFDYA